MSIIDCKNFHYLREGFTIVSEQTDENTNETELLNGENN